jgi:hypothetical protein
MIMWSDPRIARLITLIRAALRPPAGAGRIALALTFGVLELWLNLVFWRFEGWRRIWLNCCCETACQPKEIHHHGND